MNTNMIMMTVMTMVVCGMGVLQAAAIPREGKGRGPGAGRTEHEKAKVESKAKLERYKTDEGLLGTVAWREYTVNPHQKGPATLLVVFGGRNSVKVGRGSVETPVAIEKAIDYARTKASNMKLHILVPDMEIERGPGERGRERPVSDGMAKLIRARAAQHGVATERVFATGFSLGGGLVYELVKSDTSLFARVLVVGASGNAEVTSDIRTEILACHGADDDYIPMARVKAFAAAVNARTPGRMTLEVLKKTGHSESETVAYSRRDLWKALLR